MVTIQEIISVLELLAPTDLAEDWDNVGLLVGDRSKEAKRIMTCLTVTPATVAEAVEKQASLIVSHHPLPFHSLKKITCDNRDGKLLLKLIESGIAVYSAHTAYDSARAGINQHLAIALKLVEIKPLILMPNHSDPEIGTGRIGKLTEEIPLKELAQQFKANFLLNHVQVVGQEDQAVSKVGIACGSGGSMLDAAITAGCDGFITGEATFHTCLAAEASGVAMLLVGHFASERFAMELLAEYLGEQCPGVEVWTSKDERDPIKTV